MSIPNSITMQIWCCCWLPSYPFLVARFAFYLVWPSIEQYPNKPKWPSCMVYCKSTNSGPPSSDFFGAEFSLFWGNFFEIKLGKTFISMWKFKCVLPAKDLPLLKNHKSIKRKKTWLKHWIIQNKNSSFQNSTSSTWGNNE